MVFRCTRIRQSHVFLTHPPRRNPGNGSSPWDEPVWASRKLELSVYHRETEDSFSYNLITKHHQEGLQNFYSKGAITASPLEEKEAKVMPLIAAKVSQLQVQRKWKLYYHNPREKAFAQYRREQHRQVLKRGKINRFPTTRALDLPLGYPSALPHFQHSAMAGNQYGKQQLSGLDWDEQTNRQQQGDGWEEECHQAEIYGKYQRPTKKKRDKELQV